MVRFVVMRALLLCVAILVATSALAHGDPPEDVTQKFACSTVEDGEALAIDFDGIIQDMCANAAIADPYVRIEVCDGTVVGGLVGAADALASIPSMCDVKPPAQAPLMEWKCAGGRGFAGRIDEFLAVIKTGSEQHMLLHSPTSPEGLYEGRGVVLQRTEGLADLTGANGGPYERCVA